MNYLPIDVLMYIQTYIKFRDLINLSRICNICRKISQEYLNDNAIIIQRIYRHHRNGRRKRKEIERKYRLFIWKCKRFQVERKLDSTPYMYSKTNRSYVDRIYDKINVSLHQDSDDEEDYSLTTDQNIILNSVKIKQNIYKRDIRKILSSLTLAQLQFV